MRSLARAALLLALLIGCMALTAPSDATTRGWSTLYTTARLMKAQACYSYLGQDRVRADARVAKVGGRVQMETSSLVDGRWENHWSPWVWAAKGTVSAAHTMELPWSSRSRVRVRVRTRFGTSHWSTWHASGNLKRC